MPEGKRYHYFMSHKKHHSKHGDVSQATALTLHDYLQGLGLIGFFDVDDLKQITQRALGNAVEESCTMIVCLTDETVQSDWCRFEWDTARKHNIPVACIVDNNFFLTKPILEQVAQVNDHLLKYPWFDYTLKHRKQSAQELLQWCTERLRFRGSSMSFDDDQAREPSIHSGKRTARSSRDVVEKDSANEVILQCHEEDDEHREDVANAEFTSVRTNVQKDDFYLPVFAVGSSVEYFSSSKGDTWIPAVVQGFSDGTYELDVNPKALPSKVRERSKAAPEVAADGLLKFAASKTQMQATALDLDDGNNEVFYPEVPEEVFRPQVAGPNTQSNCMSRFSATSCCSSGNDMHRFRL
jgi:hypothetical protein